MADEPDLAQSSIEIATAIAIATVRARVQAGVGTVLCVACGEQIPAERRRLVPGAVRCRPCQESTERHV